MIFGIFLVPKLTFGQGSIAINTDESPPDNSAMLDVKSTTQGVLLPKMTATQRTAITAPIAGLLVFQTNGASGYYY